MSIFQNIVLKKHLSSLGAKTDEAYEKYCLYFLNSQVQENIRNSKEEQFQEGFLRELFVKVLGYTLNPEPDFNLITEKKNEGSAKKADGAILVGGEVVGIIELKDHKTTDLNQVKEQAFGYKNHHRKASYVVISNFEKLRFYIDNAVEFIEFNLFTLTADEFAILWLCLAYENVELGLPKRIRDESISDEKIITDKLYKEYSIFKRALFSDLVACNPQYDKLTLFKKSQKLLDRLLFICFAEDKLLLPSNSLQRLIDKWRKYKVDPMNDYQSLYMRLTKYFHLLDVGHLPDIYAYNGGLFKPDEVLDAVEVSDVVLESHIEKLAGYDFATEIDVNILGHIFENSLNEIEEITAEITTGVKPASQKKKDGVFYTPKYITTYIVENTLGKLCAEKRIEVNFDEIEQSVDKIFPKKEVSIIQNEAQRQQRSYSIRSLKKRSSALTTDQKEIQQKMDKRLLEYRSWLLSLSICDPACGSGAFLNAALDFLIAEHRYIDDLTSKIYGHPRASLDIEISILEKNLFGVDINEEGVEIAKLSLWLRTAKPHRKLNSLSDNIKCGNSLISDPDVAGVKAFDWAREFPQVFANGGFDVIIGNPPYVDSEIMVKCQPNERMYLAKQYATANGNWDLFVIFIEKAMLLLKPCGLMSYILPNKLIAAKYANDIRRLMASRDLLQVVDYGKVSVFPDADVYPCIFVLRNDNQNNDVYIARMCTETDVEFSSIVDQRLLESGLFWDAYFFNKVTTDIIQKVNSHSNYISSEFTVLGAATVNEAYLLKNVLQDNNVSQGCRKLINTGTIDRYHSLWGYSNTQYINGSYKYPVVTDNDVAGINKTRYVQSCKPKIIIAGMALCVEAFYDEGEYLAGKSTIIIQGQSDDLRFLLTIINSKLISFWFQKSFNSLRMSGGYFNFGVNEVSLIPFVNLGAKQPFIELADNMLEMNKALYGKRQKFLKRLADNFERLIITKSIKKFDELEFKAFVAELKKQKITLSLKQQDEWEEYFNEYKITCSDLTAQIKATDQKIDTMVYDLYNLTPEEIAIVEES